MLTIDVIKFALAFIAVGLYLYFIIFWPGQRTAPGLPTYRQMPPPPERKVSEDEIDERVAAALSKMLNENSTKMLSILVACTGEKCITKNVDTLTISAQHDFKGKRYATQAVITVEEV